MNFFNSRLVTAFDGISFREQKALWAGRWRKTFTVPFPNYVMVTFTPLNMNNGMSQYLDHSFMDKYILYMLVSWRTQSNYNLPGALSAMFLTKLLKEFIAEGEGGLSSLGPLSIGVTISINLDSPL